MKTLKLMATIDEQGQLILERPLMSDRNSRVQVIVLIPEGAEEASKMGKESKETLLSTSLARSHDRTNNSRGSTLGRA